MDKKEILSRDTDRFWGSLIFALGLAYELAEGLFGVLLLPKNPDYDPSRVKPASQLPLWHTPWWVLLLSVMGAFVVGLGARLIVRSKGFPTFLSALCFVPPSLGVVGYYLHLIGIALVCVLPRRPITNSVASQAPTRPKEGS